MRLIKNLTTSALLLGIINIAQASEISISNDLSPITPNSANGNLELNSSLAPEGPIDGAPENVWDPSTSNLAGEPTSGNSTIPVDGGISLLLMAGAGLGARKLRNKLKIQQ